MKIEIWNTKQGKSVRVVERAKGKFANNKSAKQLSKLQQKVSK